MKQCGLLVFVDGSAYASLTVAAGGPTGNIEPFTPVAQSAVTGSGSPLDPIQVTTKVRAGSTGLELVQVDSYVRGRNTYRSELSLSNQDTAAHDVTVYRGMNCFSDYESPISSYGYASQASIGCTLASNGQGKTVSWGPITPGASFISAPLNNPSQGFSGYDGTVLPNTCQCDVLDYRSAVVRWGERLAGGKRATYSWDSRFSLDGRDPLQLELRSSESHVHVNEPVDLSVAVNNAYPSSAEIGSITVTLPPSAHYVGGTAKGLTNQQPSVAAGQITFTDLADVPASSRGELSFQVKFDAPGTMRAEATASAPTAFYAPAGDPSLLTVSATAVGTRPGTPSLIAPDQGDVVASGRLLVSWAAAKDAESYVVHVDGVAQAAVSKLRSTVTLTPGDHSIRVDAINGTGASPSEVATVFAIETDREARSAFSDKATKSQKAALASRFRPRFYFDGEEHWRPLDTKAFFAEGWHKLCVDRTSALPDRCRPLTRYADLFSCQTFADRLGRDDRECFGGSNAYIDIHGHKPSGYTGDLGECLRPVVWDCTDLQHSKVHYNVLVGRSRVYVDYWLFYRYNQWNPPIPPVEPDNHEGDWEGVTIWLMKRAPDRVHTVIFASHKDRSRYLRDVILPYNFTERSRVFIARGSHASYPRPCTYDCRQASGGLPETPYDGKSPWLQNEPSQCPAGKCLIALPADPVKPGSEARATPNTFSSWNGKWGKGVSAGCKLGKLPKVDAPFGCGPGSPGDQARFKRPWSLTQDRTGIATAASREVASAAATDSERVLCDDGWFGQGIVATVCDQPALDGYMALATEPDVPTTLALSTTADGTRTAASGGIAQAMADKPLPPLGRITVAGEASDSAVLSVRAIDAAGVIREAKIRRLGLTGEGTLDVRSNEKGTALAILRPDGGASVQELRLPRDSFAASARQTKRGTRVTLSTPVNGTAKLTLRRGARRLTTSVTLIARRNAVVLARLRARRRTVKPTSVTIAFRPVGGDPPQTITIRPR